MNQMQFFRILVILNGGVPFCMLLWDAYRGQLGANAVNNALHVTGLLSLIFLFLTLLMSPLHWLTKWGGWIASRRALGLYGFFYAIVHLLIYVGFDRALSLSSTLNEIWMRRFLQVGTIALLLMVPLAVTSTNAMIQWMGPKSWKLLHRATYLAVILGVVHYYMLVKSDVRQPLAFAGVLAVLLVGRFVYHYLSLLRAAAKTTPRPTASPQMAAARFASPAGAKPRQGWKGELRIGAIFQETPDVKTFRLVAVDGGALPFAYQPGQFANLQLQIDGKRINRSYTIASSPTRGEYCELTIKREPMGMASRFIHDHWKVGDLIKVSGPSGKFTFGGDEESSVLLVGGGVGITPVMSIARALTDRAWHGDLYFLFTAKTEADLIYRDELKWLEDRFPNFHVLATLSRCDDNSSWKGARGRITESLLKGFVPNLGEVPVFLCGPNEMMDSVREMLIRIGVPESRIKTEAFAGKKQAASATASDIAEGDPPPLVANRLNGFPKALPASRSYANGAAVAVKETTTAIHFAQSGATAEASSETTILEAAEEVAISLPFECRSGFCGQCKTRLLEGRVVMDCEDALNPKEKAAGWVLSCQARPLSPCTVEA